MNELRALGELGKRIRTDVFATLRQPGQLRTERHEQVMRYMDMLESKDFDEKTQSEIGILIEDSREQTTSRRSASRSTRKEKP